MLYADDLVLISKTKQGLQNLLNTLKVYTENWFMDVNMTKTKCLVFGLRKDIKTQLYFGSRSLENSGSYTYLGTTFSWNGTFTQATKDLQEKGSKAMYGLLSKILK